MRNNENNSIAENALVNMRFANLLGSVLCYHMM